MYPLSESGVVLLVIFKQSMRKILVDFIEDDEVVSSWYTSKLAVVLVFAILMMPFAFKRKITRTEECSYIASSGIIVYLLLLTAHFIA